MSMRMQLPTRSTKTPELRRAFYDRLDAASWPAIAGRRGRRAHDERAAVRRRPPRRSRSKGVRRASRRRAAAGDDRSRSARASSTTAGVQLRRGRGFTETDGTAGAETIVINERWRRSSSPARIRLAAASGSCPGEAPPGRPAAAVWRTIVGISPSIRHSNPQDRRAQPAVVYRAAPAGSAGRRVAHGPQPPRARRGDERRAPRGAGHRSGSAGLHHADDESDARAAAVAVPRVRHASSRSSRSSRSCCRRSGSMR